MFFFFSSRRRHTRWPRDWSSDVCSSDLDTSNPHTSHRRTLWGELAWQIGGPEGYGQVAEQDRLGVAPGGDVLARLIGDTPTLLLLDEVLLYVENAMGVVVGESTLGRQTIAFLQRLTEVV